MTSPTFPRARRAAFLLCAMPALLAVPAAAQEPSSAPPRPRLCLVLSGGGARGLAHVGVLRALEDLHVPVDCVAGTSMGALVGGLYAAGYSPEELERIGTTLDWRGMIRDAADRKHLPYRRKVDDLTYLSRFEFGLSGRGLRTPAGLVAGHRIGAALHVYALRAGRVTDFDALPIPFRAVATNATTGESVVLGQGDLGSALHASMAIPGLFAPIDRDGALLVDGGVVNNVPVDAAQAMGAGAIVAVDVGQPLAARERLDTIASVLNNSLGALSRREAERALARADVVVRPDVGDIGSLAFDDPVRLYALGREAVAARAAELRRFAVDEVAWERHLAAIRRAAPALRIASIAIDPGPGMPSRLLEKAVRTRPGQPLDPPTLAADLDRIWELGAFETVDYTLERGAGDGWDLRIRARGKAIGPNVLRAGVAVTSDLEGSSSFNALTALTMTRLNRRGAELKLAVQAGESTMGSVELYQPLTPGGLPFAAIGYAAGPVKVQLPVDDQLVQYRFFDQWLTLDLGLALGRYGELRAGVFRESLTGRATDGHHCDAPRYDSPHAGLRARLAIDQLDRVNFPRNGLLAIVEAYDSSRSLGSDEDYRRCDVQFVGAASRGRHTLLGVVHGSTALGGTLPVRDRLWLGGLFRLSGLPPGELSGSYGGVAALVYMFRLGRAGSFADGVYVGGTVEAGNAWERADDVRLGDLRHSAALVFGIDTALGPVYAAHGWTTGGKDSFYLYLGRSF